MRLGTAGNTQGSALYIIEVIKGYAVFYDSAEDSDYSQWIAVKDDNKFFAETAESLLGLIVIYETLGTRWSEYSGYDVNHIYERDV